MVSRWKNGKPKKRTKKQERLTISKRSAEVALITRMLMTVDWDIVRRQCTERCEDKKSVRIALGIVNID
jgi:hypothetical protein